MIQNKEQYSGYSYEFHFISCRKCNVIHDLKKKKNTKIHGNTETKKKQLEREQQNLQN